jgi:hypothetical protein
LSDPDDSDSEPETVRVASEFHSYGEESPIIPTQVHGLLFQLGITKAPEYKVKSVPKLGSMEFTCTVEVFDGQEVIGKHACSAPCVTCAEAVADAAWQALTSWSCSQHHDLKNSIYALYPRRMKDAFKISSGPIDLQRSDVSQHESLSGAE